MIVDLTGYNACTGMCDLLRQVTFCAAIAQIRGKNSLCLRQVAGTGCPEPILDLLEIEGFDLSPWTPEKGEADIRLNSFTSFPSLKNAREQVAKAGIHEIDAFEFLNRWQAAYTLIRPKEQTRATLECLAVGDDCLGLHVRVTDKAVKNPSPYEVHHKRMPSVTRRTKGAVQAHLNALKLKKVYLACDDIAAKALWERLLASRGIRLISNRDVDYDPSRLRQTSGHDFMVDLFSLSRCRVVVGTINSGVPVTAALISRRPIEKIIWGRYYRPLLGLKLNHRLHHLRRIVKRRRLLEGQDFCPSLAFFNGTLVGGALPRRSLSR